nr:EOG090X0EPT [Lepidurus arcticus]
MEEKVEEKLQSIKGHILSRDVPPGTEKPNATTKASMNGIAEEEKDHMGAFFDAPSYRNDFNRNALRSGNGLKSTVKLLDDNLEFSDRLQEFLLDQPDFLVVAVVGLQGTGKSTILSAIAREDISLNDIFPRSSKEQLLISEASTLGIDVFVSSNRVIYLDCQPFLSTALANTEINNPGELFKDSYISYEPPSIETSMEIKALQLLAFVMCVCHHLILVQDWMFDTNLIRLIYIAEMLKPAIPGFEDQYEHYPNLIVVHNKVEGDAAGPASIKLLQESYSDCFQKTRLAFSNSNGFFQGRISDHSVNLVLLPSFGNADMTSDCVPFSFLEAFDEEIRKMREQLFCLPWEGLTLSALTEKNW